MSQMSVLDALSRISEADPESPVAVFLGSSVSRVDVRFASTIDTQRRIMAGDPDLIGIYSRDSARSRIMADIQRVRSGQGRPGGPAAINPGAHAHGKSMPNFVGWGAGRTERRQLFDRRNRLHRAPLSAVGDGVHN